MLFFLLDRWAEPRSVRSAKQRADLYWTTRLSVFDVPQRRPGWTAIVAIRRRIAQLCAELGYDVGKLRQKLRAAGL